MFYIIGINIQADIDNKLKVARDLCDALNIQFLRQTMLKVLYSPTCPLYYSREKRR